ncbi:C-type lectin domain family 2 member L-like isoform 1-T2 [Discoglossus pictus]
MSRAPSAGRVPERGPSAAEGQEKASDPKGQFLEQTEEAGVQTKDENHLLNPSVTLRQYSRTTRPRLASIKRVSQRLSSVEPGQKAKHMVCTWWTSMDEIPRYVSIPLAAIVVLSFVGFLVYHNYGTRSDPCPNDWMWFNRTCYFFSETEQDWKSSRDFCKEKGGALAGLNDFKIKKAVDKWKRYVSWVGLKKNSEGTWMWLDGSPLGDQRVANDGDGLNCAYMDSQLGALDCSTRRSWVCTKESA